MPEHREAILAAERQAQEELEPMPVQIGYDYAFMQAKRRILRERYGLNWKPPRK